MTAKTYGKKKVPLDVFLEIQKWACESTNDAHGFVSVQLLIKRNLAANRRVNLSGLSDQDFPVLRKNLGTAVLCGIQQQNSNVWHVQPEFKLTEKQIMCHII